MKMTVYYQKAKYVLNDPTTDKENFYKICKEYGVIFDIKKYSRKVLRESDVREWLARVDEADFLVYESYGFIYIYEVGV